MASPTFNREHKGVIPRTAAQAESQNVVYYYPESECDKHPFAQHLVLGRRCQECAHIAHAKRQAEESVIRAAQVKKAIDSQREARALQAEIGEVCQ